MPRAHPTDHRQLPTPVFIFRDPFRLAHQQRSIPLVLKLTAERKMRKKNMSV
jgi:hypothetical protein